MMLFFIGIIEMLIISAWTKFVSETKVFSSGALTMINIFIWYYILNTFVNDINNWQLIALYASGCTIGTMLTTAYFRYEKKLKLAKKATKKYEEARVNPAVR